MIDNHIENMNPQQPSPSTTISLKLNLYNNLPTWQEMSGTGILKRVMIIEALHSLLIPKALAKRETAPMFIHNGVPKEIWILILSYFTYSEMSVLYRINKSCREFCESYVYYIVYNFPENLSDCLDFVKKILALFEKCYPGVCTWCLISLDEVKKAVKLGSKRIFHSGILTFTSYSKIPSLLDTSGASIPKLVDLLFEKKTSNSEDPDSIPNELLQLPGLSAIFPIGVPYRRKGMIYLTIRDDLHTFSTALRGPSDPPVWKSCSSEAFTIITKGCARFGLINIFKKLKELDPESSEAFFLKFKIIYFIYDDDEHSFLLFQIHLKNLQDFHMMNCFLGEMYGYGYEPFIPIWNYNDSDLYSALKKISEIYNKPGPRAIETTTQTLFANPKLLDVNIYLPR